MKHKNLLPLVVLTLMLSTVMAFAETEGTVTAYLDTDKINPGDTIIVAGNITDLSAQVSFDITVHNATDGSLNSTVTAQTLSENDGNFSVSYGTSATAAPGDYYFNVTYDLDTVILDFEVEAVEPEEPEDPEDPDDDDDCENLAVAIERAQVYLDRVREMLENMADEYSDDPEIMEKLTELNATLDMAQEYLVNATEYLEAGECNLAARSHAAARNLIGRIKGLLSSVNKAVKVQKVERFMEQFQRRINNTQDKVEDLASKLGASNTEKVKSNIGNAWGKVQKYQSCVTASNVDDVLKGLHRAVGQVDDELDEMGDEESANKIKNMNRYTAHVDVLQKSVERLQRRGAGSSDLSLQLSNAQGLLSKFQLQLDDDDTEDIEDSMNRARDALRAAKDSLKSNNGKSNDRYNDSTSSSSNKINRGSLKSSKSNKSK